MCGSHCKKGSEVLEWLLGGDDMALEYALFDLDGTLTDSMEGITNCARYALEKFGIHPQSQAELLPYIGPPLVYSFETFHGLTKEQ